MRRKEQSQVLTELDAKDAHRRRQKYLEDLKYDNPASYEYETVTKPRLLKEAAEKRLAKARDSNPDRGGRVANTRPKSNRPLPQTDRAPLTGAGRAPPASVKVSKPRSKAGSNAALGLTAARPMMKAPSRPIQSPRISAGEWNASPAIGSQKDTSTGADRARPASVMVDYRK